MPLSIWLALEVGKHMTKATMILFGVRLSNEKNPPKSCVTHPYKNVGERTADLLTKPAVLILFGVEFGY